MPTSHPAPNCEHRANGLPAGRPLEIGFRRVSASFTMRHPSSLDDNIFSFAEISYRLFDQIVQSFFVGFSVHGNIRVAARP